MSRRCAHPTHRAYRLVGPLVAVALGLGLASWASVAVISTGFASSGASLHITGAPLHVTGATAGNPITISPASAARLPIEGGAELPQAGAPTVANTFVVQVVGQGDEGAVRLSEAVGRLPHARSTPRS